MQNSNNFRIKQITKKVTRRDYSKIKTEFEGPNLLEVQVESFKRFIDRDLKEAVGGIFPLKSPQGKYSLHFKGLRIKEPAKTEELCRDEAKTYETPVYIDLELVDNFTGEVKRAQKNSKTGEDGIYLGAVPKMTEKGTFIINGIEKFVVSQIVRSPGIYVLSKSNIKLNGSRKRLFEGKICEIYPSKGTLMLGYIPKDKEVIQVVARDSSGDNAQTLSITTLLKAFGLSEGEILRVFANEYEVVESLRSENYDRESILLNTEQNEIIIKILSEIHEINEKADRKDINKIREEYIIGNSPLLSTLKKLLFSYVEKSEQLDLLLHENGDVYNDEFIAKNQDLINEINQILDEIISESSKRCCWLIRN